MRNTKLYSLLESFDKYEHNRLLKFISSPYFNKNQAIIDLYKSLRTAIFSKKNISLGKEKLWKKVYKGEDYDDVRFRKLVSDLLKLVESFMAQQIYEENPLHQATYLIEAVGKRKIEQLYNSTMRTARRLSEKQEYKPASYYFYQYQIEKNYYDLTRTKFKRDERTNFEEIINNLDWFYLAEKLKYNCNILSQKTLVSHDYSLLFIDEIIEHIYKYNYDQIPPIAIYFQIYLMLSDFEEEKHFQNLKKLIETHITEFPQDDASYIYNYAFNYCIRKVNRGKGYFMKEFFELYQYALKEDVILVNGELSPWHFKNIVLAALRLGKYVWVKKFIKDYSVKLPETMRENALSFNLAQLYFYKKDYDNVKSMLQEVEYEDLSYNLNSKSFLLMTYYETDDFEPLESLLESFKVYLNRHKDIPESRRNLYMNLIRFVKKLTRLMPGDKKAIETIKKEVDETKGIASEKWLKEKIAELE